MLVDPLRRVGSLPKRESQRDEVHRDVQPHQGEGHNGCPLRPIIHPDWQNDEHRNFAGKTRVTRWRLWPMPQSFWCSFLIPCTAGRRQSPNSSRPPLHHSTTPSLPHSAFVDTLHAFSYPPPVNTERVYPEFTSGLFIAGAAARQALEPFKLCRIRYWSAPSGATKAKAKSLT